MTGRPLRHLRYQFATGLCFVVYGTVGWLGGVTVLPVLLDLGAAALFLGPPFTARPLVERIARALALDLPPQGEHHARRVTEARGVLMTVVALVALYTAVAGSLHLWSLFNGVIVYVVTGVAFGCEYLLRRHVNKRWTRA